jgi:hypothetical protein
MPTSQLGEVIIWATYQVGVTRICYGTTPAIYIAVQTASLFTNRSTKHETPIELLGRAILHCLRYRECIGC